MQLNCVLSDRQDLFHMDSHRMGVRYGGLCIKLQKESAVNLEWSAFSCIALQQDARNSSDHFDWSQ